MIKLQRTPKSIITLLEEGIQASRMKTARLGGIGASDTLTEEVREVTRIYRETWVEQPLLVALAYLKGEITAAQAEDLWLVDHRRIDEDINDPRIALGLIGRNENFEA